MTDMDSNHEMRHARHTHHNLNKGSRHPTMNEQTCTHRINKVTDMDSNLNKFGHVVIAPKHDTRQVINTSLTMQTD